MNNFWQKLKKPIIGLAPMDGVTDFPMRQIQCSINKPSVLYTEFISAEGFIRNQKHFEKTLYFEENQKPIVAQVFGYTPEAFYETILQITEMGFDGIDLNMGCPAKSVLGKGGGGALIGNFDLSEKLIIKSFEAIKDSGKNIPLSVKTRIGIKPNLAKEWFNFLSGFPLSEITIHGRLLKDGHSGENNWEEIAIASQILKEKNIVCLGNGGVKSISDAYQVCKEFDLDGILIGQGALGNPWAFRKDYIVSKEEILDTILKHAKYVSEFYPPERFVTVLKHFGWYPKNFKDCKHLKIELLKTRNYNEVEQVIAKFR